MNFDLDLDQAGFDDSLHRLLADAAAPPAGHVGAFVSDPALERVLQRSGFFDQDILREMEPLSAALMIERIAGLATSLEVGASALIAPRASPTPLPRPIATAGSDVLGRPIRFLPEARTLIFEAEGGVRALDLATCSVSPLPTAFAFSYGVLARADLAAAAVLNITIADYRRLRRVSVAAELIGAMDGAFSLTLDYIKARHQFKRPIGSFQAVRHRMAECASVLAGARHLVHRAVWSEDVADAALALSFAQEAAARVVYESHQFHGAIGLTLEYPLHFWTYRLRALQGELGGTSINGADAADIIWRDQG